MTIIILGLGPGDPAHLTREAWDVLSQASEVYLRTARHPTVASLPADLTVHSFDDLYEAQDDFVGVYDTIAERVVALGRRRQRVLYAVPGHPLVGESSVRRILHRAREEGLGVRLVEGLSFVEPVLSLLEIDGLDGLQLADATDLAAAHHPSLDPDRPALIGQLYGRRLASEVKLTLMNAYPDEHPVRLVRAAGTHEGTAITLPLYELDRSQTIDHLTTLYLPPLPHVGSLPAFQATVARLRAPDGCPWDREQTHRTLGPNLLEETYEVLAALDAEDDDKLCEELGDLLMQIAMHVQIATEEGAFRFADVIGAIDAKLKRRHPHVFGDLEVRGTADVLRNWEAIKARERAAAGEGNAHRSRLEGVPVTLPALARAQSLGDRAARAGFDWPDLEGVLAKVGEEVAELRGVEDPEAQAQELGDLLFAMVNVARWLGVDAESALRGTCDRFTRRYAAMEQAASARGIDLADLPLDEQDALWNRVKREGGDGSV
jgi:tetrapyrrole methylase family protein/MazG family protein